jgi:hypothetical protein
LREKGRRSAGLFCKVAVPAAAWCAYQKFELLLHEERASWQWLNDLRNNAPVGTDRLQADRKPTSDTFENCLNETQHVCKTASTPGSTEAAALR